MKYNVDVRDFKVEVGVATGPRGLTDNVLHYVRHDADAGAARPAEATVVLWVGSVTPTNADTGTDMWVDTA